MSNLVISVLGAATTFLLTVLYVDHPAAYGFGGILAGVWCLVMTFHVDWRKDTKPIDWGAVRADGAVFVALTLAFGASMLVALNTKEMVFLHVAFSTGVLYGFTRMVDNWIPVLALFAGTVCGVVGSLYT